MQEFLSQVIGRQMDIYCSGAATLRGELVKIEGGVLHVKDDEGRMSYIAIDKIVAVWDVREEESRAGFTSRAHK